MSEYQQWVKVLTQELPENEKRYGELLDSFRGYIPMTVSALRQELFQRGGGRVSVEQLQSVSNSKELAELLSEMFLEVIGDHQVPGILKTMNKNGWDWNKLYIAHEQNIVAGNYKRILRVIGSPCKTS